MENLVSNLRSFAIDTYRTSMEAVNTFELGVVPFITRHFVLPTDVDTKISYKYFHDIFSKIYLL